MPYGETDSQNWPFRVTNCKNWIKVFERNSVKNFNGGTVDAKEGSSYGNKIKGNNGEMDGVKRNKDNYFRNQKVI